MKRVTFILLAIYFFASCTSKKSMMNSWLGRSKQDLIQNFGEPAKAASDGRTGQIIVYGAGVSKEKNNTTYYDYKIFYLNHQDKVYDWLLKSGKTPPSQIDLSSFKRY
jgi:hypothetical protein